MTAARRAPRGAAPGAPGTIAYGTPAGRWVLLATVLASGMAFLDSTVVNVALPTIREELGAGLAGLQWIVDGYLLALGALILLGGSLGDLYGRKRVFSAGLVAFTAASALCGAAPTTATLIAARVLQGAGAALMVPGSLAIISTTFRLDDRAQAIGAWSGLSGVSTAIGPFLGGWLVEAASWRLVFLLNVPLAIVALAVTARHLPDSRDVAGAKRPDGAGAVTAALGLGGVVFALIEGPVRGWADPLVVGCAVAGVGLLVVFGAVEHLRAQPMLPLQIFRSRQFSGANATTFAVYGALTAALFLVSIELQTQLGYSALEAGAATVPITVLLLLLSPFAGRLARRRGARVPMTVGPLLAGGGLLLLRLVEPGAAYVTGVLPGVLTFGLGLSLTVAPLTAAALGAVEERRAGIGSAVNNAVARVAGLLAVALLPAAAGLSGVEGAAFTAGFHRAMALAAALCAAGGAVAWLTIPGAPAAARS